MISRVSRRILRLQRGHEVNFFRSLPAISAPTCQRLSIKRDLSTASDKKDEGTLKNEDEPGQQINPEVEENVEITRLNDALSDMKDKYQRSLAENENVRKRLRKEISDSKLYAIQGFCKDLLTVADILSTAVDTAPEQTSQSTESNKKWDDFHEGVKMTKEELMSVFKRHGLVQFTPEKGDKFDPNKHEAMFQAPVPELEPGHVAHVQGSGYLLHDRTLRPAQVGVSK